MLIILGNASMAQYPEGGGHWSWRFQFALGLRALGHQVFWLELLRPSKDPDRDRRLIGIFFDRFRQYGLGDCCALLHLDSSGIQSLDSAQAYGKSKERIKEMIKSADLLWNFCCALRQPLLSQFRRRVLIDLDPGHLQVCGLTMDLGIHDHDVVLSVGGKLHDPDCEVPALGLIWRRFRPFVYLPMWQAAPHPGPEAPFSSITQWTWEELHVADRVLSVSKRDAYLRYVSLPRISRCRFELAANIGPEDPANDREILSSHGWRLVDPHRVAGSPSDYRSYIETSRAEFLVPKPIFRELRTGWFSDRSVCYLATGRPVLAEDTGFSERIPTGRGLLAFNDLEEAAAGSAEIQASYALHSSAARELAEAYFDHRGCLNEMLSACE